MTRFLQIVVAIGLIVSLASAAATVSTNSQVSASFAAPPGKAFDSAVTADTTTWGTYTKVWFGPGKTNATVYAYGILYGATGSLTSITKIASRALNATLLTNGTADTTMSASAGTTDGAVTLTAVSTNTHMFAVGTGSVGFAYTQIDTATVPTTQVYFSMYEGGSSSLTIAAKAITAVAAVTCSATVDGVTWGTTVHNVFFDNGTYYIAYTTTKSIIPMAATCGTAITSVVVTTYLQGYANSSAATAMWTTAPTIYTKTTTGSVADPLASELKTMCGPNNYTNSSMIYCTYKDAVTATANLALVQVTVSTGAAGSATTIATDTTAVVTTITTTVVHTHGGFIYGYYQQGILINKFTTAVDTATTTTYANALGIYNLTTGASATAGGAAITGYTNTLATGQFGGAGLTYAKTDMTGYLLADQYISTAGTGGATPWTTTFEYATFYANSTANLTKTTIAQVQNGKGNWFVASDATLWFGSYTTTYDAATVPVETVLVGMLGKVSTIYTFSAGNVLATVFALLSFMIAAIFAL